MQDGLVGEEMGEEGAISALSQLGLWAGSTGG